mmetsp:Transcript_6179/g.10772  ORF Transcript_6179/g.10772 Transcript_6179/m.10772 type:complete len:178 (+) Transcript_6179:87-620(+)
MKGALAAVFLLQCIGILRAKHFRPICRASLSRVYSEGNNGEVSCDVITHPGSGGETAVKEACFKAADTTVNAIEMFNPHSIVASSDECNILWDAVTAFCEKQGSEQQLVFTIRKFCKKVHKEYLEDSAQAVDSIQVAYVVMVGASCLVCAAVCSRVFWCYWSWCGRSKSPLAEPLVS